MRLRNRRAVVPPDVAEAIEAVRSRIQSLPAERRPVAVRDLNEWERHPDDFTALLRCRRHAKNAGVDVDAYREFRGGRD